MILLHKWKYEVGFSLFTRSASSGKESLWGVSISALCIKYDYRELRFILYSLFLYVFVTERIKMVDIVSDEENEFAVPKFTIYGEITRQYRRFNAFGTELTVRPLPPARGDDSDAVTHFQASVTDFLIMLCGIVGILIWSDSRYVMRST